MERIQVLVCAGTGCSIGNSGALIDAFRAEIKSMGLENEVSVLRTGCLGLCGVGPNVSIYPDKKLLWNTFIKDVQFIA